MITIDWDKYDSDGKVKGRGKLPASTVHGWLAKMRGTLIGDEALRSRGMREMEQAQKNRNAKRKAARRLGLFGLSKKPESLLRRKGHRPQHSGNPFRFATQTTRSPVKPKSSHKLSTKPSTKPSTKLPVRLGRGERSTIARKPRARR